jgi:hypothetical protein
MKHISKFNQFITEAISSEVYHFTALDHLIGMLQSDTINLSTHLGTEADNKDSKGFYFLSVSRTKSPLVGYGSTMSLYGGTFVRIQLDGKKLNHKFKGGAVDYWQMKDPKNYMIQGKDVDYVKQTVNRKFEMEDRVYSNTPELTNLSRYIVKIDAFINIEKTDKKMVLSVMELADKHDINLNLYDNIKDFMRGDTTQTINNRIEDSGIENIDSYDYHDHFDTHFLEKTMVVAIMDASLLDSYDEEKITSEIETLKKKYGIEGDVDWYKVMERMRYLRYGKMNISDFVSSISADIHTLSKRGRSSVNRVFMRIISDTLRKYKVKTISDLIYLKIMQQKPAYLTNGKYSNKYELYWVAYEGEPVHPIDGTKTIEEQKYENVIFSFYLLRDFMNDEAVYQLYDLERTGTINDLIDHLMTKYTLNRVEYILEVCTNKRISIKRK